MKKLTVYVSGSHFVYENLYISHMFEIMSDQNLIITTRDEVTGDETIRAAFRTWNYFLIEED